ncbi:hypothetical protein BG006_001939 [Podila minutissima]|uniref:Uncharacterized protein n=1 Tax=Podila minutissima TaxID=64525 RepID=A0A9P5SBZ8_9FUNG|nr:hypothetical protein BG006_001939 [Podila minutissima]
MPQVHIPIGSLHDEWQHVLSDQQYAEQSRRSTLSLDCGNKFYAVRTLDSGFGGDERNDCGVDAPKGPGNISCYYGTPEVSPIVLGEVFLTTNYNCSGDSILISYRAEAIIAFKEGAVTHSGSNLCDEESLKFEIVHRLFFMITSSFLNEFAVVSFALQAKLIRKYSKDIVKTEPLWMTNTLLSRYYDPPPLFTPTATPPRAPAHLR